METRLSQFAIQYRWLLLLFTLLGTALASYGMKDFQFDGSAKAFVDDNNEGLRLLSEIEDTFGRTNNAVILIGPRDEANLAEREDFIFQRQQLQLLNEFTEKSWLLPHARRVDSIINHQHSWGDEDNLYVESLLEELSERSEQDVANASRIFRQEPAVLNRLLTADGNFAGLIIEFTIDDKDQDAANEAARALYKLVDSLELKYPDVQLYASGTLVNNYVTMELAYTDTSKVVGTMYLAMFVLLALLLRSALAMLSIVAVTIISVLAGVGLACWFGAVFTSLTMSAVSIIITVTIAHCVHIFIGFFQNYRDAEHKYEALLETLSINLQPVFLTSLTTVVGFVSMNLSDMPPMRDLGNISAAGVAVSFFCTYTLLPAFIYALPFKPQKQVEGKGFHLFMDKFASFVIRRHVLLLISCALFSIFALYLSFQNVINTDLSKAIDKPHFIRDDNDKVDEHLGGIFNIQYQFSAKPGQSITDPEYLKALDALTAFLRAQPEVTNTFSFSDVIKRLNKNMNQDDQAFYRIPDDGDMAAQYLLLYEMSLPAGMDLSNQIAVDKKSSRLAVTFVNMDTNAVKLFWQRITDWQQQNMPEYMRHRGSSYTTIWADLTENILFSSIKGAVLALLLISLVLVVVFRSFKYGLISLVPNLLPAAFGFAFWKLYSGELNFGLMMVLTITIGIVVDDTVHFLSKYRRALEQGAANAEEAVRQAFASVGPALFVTTLVLVTGFSILMTSQFFDNSTQGLLICVVLVAALLLDFLMLPPLLLVFRDRAEDKAAIAEESDQKSGLAALGEGSPSLQ
ncbi:MAG: MMPL family transporter [Pseudomonadales bacterium]|nr:MMPL family transporter [Pseudomonadales bacterium]